MYRCIYCKILCFLLPKQLRKIYNIRWNGLPPWQMRIDERQLCTGDWATGWPLGWYKLRMPFYLCFCGFFFVIHVYFAVHVCSFCFYLYLYFFSTVWISTRRNTLIASVLVTGKLFSLNLYSMFLKQMHQICIKRMIYNKNPIVLEPRSIEKYQLLKLVNNEVLDIRLS